LIETYSIIGGIPAYLILFDPEKNIFENIKHTFFVKEHIFYEEPEIILKEELREPKVYFNILEAMASGTTRLTDIANKAGINAKDSSAYINSLIELDIVEKENPITEKKPISKKALYFIKDNFFIFWFKYILGNKELIERERTIELLKRIEVELPTHVSMRFEKICAEFLWSRKDFNFTKLGRWWGVFRDTVSGERRPVEIDIVAINETIKEILFAECKWQSKKVGKHVALDLLKKAEQVDWCKKNRIERYIIFSRSGFNKSCLEFCQRNGILLYDLEDIKKIF
jgi:AAA+ ATPase superfamily predicted ATPase